MSKTRIVFILFITIFLCGVGYLNPYEPDAEAQKAMQSDTQVQVKSTGRWIEFIGTEINEYRIIFYPGALIKPESYAILARLLAEKGYATYVLKMPLNLSILGNNRASEILKLFPDQQFIIGGHSLGGVSAAKFAKRHQDKISGVYFLASYPDDQNSLAETSFKAISIMGSEDGIINRQALEKAKKLLPNHTTYHVILGGNHGQFGNYGAQSGDWKPAISPQEQAEQTVYLIFKWLNP